MTIRKLGRLRPPHSAPTSRPARLDCSGCVAATFGPRSPGHANVSRASLGLGGHRDSRSAAARSRLGSSTSATDCQCDARALFPWARSSRERGGCPLCVATPGCAFAPPLFPFAEAKRRRVLQRATFISPTPDLSIEPSPPNTETRHPATRGQRHERDVGRGSSRAGTKHVDGLPPIRAPRGTCVRRVPARPPTEHLSSPTQEASRDGSRPLNLCRPRRPSCHLPAKGGGVRPPRCFPPPGTDSRKGLLPVGESAESPPYATRVGRCTTKHSRCSDHVPLPGADTPSMASVCPTGRSPGTC